MVRVNSGTSRATWVDPTDAPAGRATERRSGKGLFVHPSSSQLLLAAVIGILALFALVAYAARVLQSGSHLVPRVTVALGLLIGTFPAVVYTLHRALSASA
jgi:hypothetical protein